MTIESRLRLITEDRYDFHPDEVKALAEVALTGEELAAAIYPLLNLDCEIHGTCKDCLEDGRGTHTEQTEYQREKFNKAWAKLEEVMGED